MKTATPAPRNRASANRIRWTAASLLVSAVSLLAAGARAQLIIEENGNAAGSPYYRSQVFMGVEHPSGGSFTGDDGIIYSSNNGPRSGGSFMTNATTEENGSTVNANASSLFPGGFFSGRNSVSMTVSNASAASGYYTLAGNGTRTKVQFFTAEAAAQRSVWRWRVTGTESAPFGRATGRLDFLGGQHANRDFFYLFEPTNGALSVFGPGEYTYNLSTPLDVPIDLFFWCSAFAQINRGQAPQGGNFTLTANYGSTYELTDIELYDQNEQLIPEWTMTDVETNQFVFNQNGPLPPCAARPADLIAWYPGDGSAADISGNGNHGALQNGATTALGLVGQAFSFDGNDDQIVVPHHASQNVGSNITIDAWVNLTSSGHGRTILQKRNAGNVGGYVFETTHSPFGPSNGLQWVIMIGGSYRTLQTPANALTLNTWQHVAATYDGANMRIFINGTQVATMAQTGAIDATTDPLVIGRNVPTPSLAWHGLLDEIEMFSRALSEAEIDAIVAAGAAGKCRPSGGVTFTVNTSADGNDGACSPADCSLREAINIANATTGTDTIAFNISGSGVQSIGVSSALPAITSPVTIDGYTQPGSSANTLVWGNNALPLVQLNGAATDNADGLVVQPGGSGSTIRGLIINNFDGPFHFNSSGVRLEDGSSGNAVEGCFIGTNASGTDYGSNTNGVFLINSDGNRIGGTTPAQRNLISGNIHFGIDIYAGSDNNVIQGNYIGTTAAGDAGLVNVSGGIHINSSSANLIGGTDQAAPAVATRGAAVASQNGVAPPQAPARTSTTPNGDVVVTPTYFNVISGNNGPGIQIIGGEFEGLSSEGNRILGNYIGLDGDADPDSSFPVGNEDQGILLLQFVYDTRIGETFGGGNSIAFNFGDGVQITDTFGEELRPGRSARPDGDAGNAAGNQIINNSIFANEGLGINLGNDGATPNDSQDADLGPNDFQNYPVLTSAETTGVSTTIQGTLNSTPTSIFRIDFYQSNDPCDGNVEGLNPIGSTIVVTNANGDTSFSFSGPAVSEGATITATATTASVVPGSTSEFSGCIQTTVAPLTLNAAASRKTHTGRGDFDINLPLAGTPGVECRDPAGAHTLVFTFSTQVASGGVSVTNGTASLSGSPMFSGNTMAVNFTGVADVQTITFTLNGVTDVFGQTLPTIDVRMTKLVGDTNGNGIVNSGDATQTRNRSGQASDATNFRSDVNADGTINSGDGLVVRERSGNSINP